MALTTFGANKLLDGDLAFGNGAPASHYVALLLELPGQDPAGVDLVEPPASAGYARLSIVNNATNFPAAVSGVKQLAGRFDFAEPTAPWGRVVGYALCTTAGVGTGQVYRTDRLRQARNVVVGSDPHIADGDLLIRAAANDPTD